MLINNISDLTALQKSIDEEILKLIRDPEYRKDEEKIQDFRKKFLISTKDDDGILFCILLFFLYVRFFRWNRTGY